MVKRRNDPRFKKDDLEYPIRVKFVVPQGGMSTFATDRRLDEWLSDNLGPKMWSWGPAHSSGCRQAAAYYFRLMEDAQRFIAAFPRLELADGVSVPIDTTPRERGPYPRRGIGDGWNGA